MPSKNKKLAILIYPFVSGNPYQSLLTEALEQSGTTVKLSSPVYETIPLHLLRISKNCNIVHLHWISHLYTGRTRFRFVLRTLLFCIILLWLRSKGIRLVLTLHNLIPHDAEHKPYHIFARRLIARCVHSIIVHSEPAKRKAMQHLHSQSKYIVIPHGHYRSFYRNNILRDEARSALKISLTSKVVLYFGSLRPYKGLEDILNSFGSYCKEGWVLLIAGFGKDQYVNHLRKLLPKNSALYARFVPDDKVQYYMQAADCLIFPYKESLTSGAAVLGLSFGLPIVATNNTAFEHLIRKKLCTPCDPTDAQNLYSAIEEVLSWNYDDFKTRCNRFLADCSWDKVAELHLAAYGHSVAGV